MQAILEPVRISRPQPPLGWPYSDRWTVDLTDANGAGVTLRVTEAQAKAIAQAMEAGQ